MIKLAFTFNLGSAVNPNYAFGIESPKNPQLHNLKSANLYIYIADLFVFDIQYVNFSFYLQLFATTMLVTKHWSN